MSGGWGLRRPSAPASFVGKSGPRRFAPPGSDLHVAMHRAARSANNFRRNIETTQFRGRKERRERNDTARTRSDRNFEKSTQPLRHFQRIYHSSM